MRTALLILCLIGTPHPSPSDQKTTNPAQSKSQTDKQPSKPLASLPTGEQPPNYTADQNGTNVTSAPNEQAARIVSLPPRSAGDAIALICTVLLTLSAIVGIIVAICTLRTIAQQTGATVIAARATQASALATQVSAEAAESQARAMVASERAWVDGYLVLTEKASVRLYKLRIKNHGKTPARIAGYDVWYGPLQRGAHFSPQSLANSRTENMHILLGSAQSEDLEEDIRMDRLFACSTEDGAYYVTVRYIDLIVHEPHETSFLYVYSPTISDLDRISAENRYS